MPDPREIPRRAKAVVKSTVGVHPDLFDLIHAIKNEIVGRLELLQGDLDSTATSLSEEVAIAGMAAHSAEALARANQAEMRAARDELAFARASIEDLLGRNTLSRMRKERAQIDQFDEQLAFFLNYAHSHEGPLAARNLWLNNPVVVEWQERNARVGAVNERIVEVPFVMQSLGALAPGANILDIGGGESTLGFSLASLGYLTTVVEPQGYPFTHPNLRVSLQALESGDVDERFDAVILLSTIEHFGIGHYAGGPEPTMDADLEALRLIRTRLIKDEGILILTTPYGPAEVNDVERIYDNERLHRLLAGWDIDVVRVAQRTNSTSWTLISDHLVDEPASGSVVMVTARPSST